MTDFLCRVAAEAMTCALVVPPPPAPVPPPVVIAEPVPAPAPAPAPTPPPASPIPAGYTVKNAAFACNGSDVTAALQAALNGLASYQALALPTGTCKTTKYVSLFGKSNVIVFGAGKDQTIIAAATPTSSAFVVEQSNGVTLQDFQVYSVNATARISDGGARAFSVNNSKFVTLQRIKGRKTSNAVAFWKTNDSKILDSEALDTFADAFHITGAAQRITVERNIARNAGDDSFSSIGYAGEGANNTVTFADNQSLDGWHGSCVAFEGTINGKALRNKCYRSGAAGIRVQSWNTYPTAPQDGIEIRENWIEGAVTRADIGTGHGAISVHTNYNYIHGVTIAGNTIKDPKFGVGVKAFGLSSTKNVTGQATANVFLGTVGTPFAIGTYATITRSGNTLNGAPVP